MSFHVCWHLDDAVDLIVDHAPPGPLPRRYVVVPSTRVAHAARCALVERAPDTLAGTTFLTLHALAERIVRSAQGDLRLGEEQLRPARLRRAFASLELAHFDPSLLAETRGWDHAFAKTIGELEHAGLAPKLLRLAGEPRCDDLAALWQAVTTSAGTSWSRSRILAEAAAQLAGGCPPWLRDTATVAICPSSTAGVAAKLIRRLPHVRVAYLAARPRRPHHVERVDEAFGSDAASALASSRPPSSTPNLLGQVQANLFGRDATPLGSDGDTSVTLEETAGVTEEIDAAVQWVTARVGAGVPLGKIAVLAPQRDPYVSLLFERLRTLPPAGEPLAVHVAGGLPAGNSAAGARIQLVLDALARHLDAAAMATLLPVLRLEGGTRRPSKAQGLELAYGLGTAGGSDGHPGGALAWGPRVRAHLDASKDQLARLEHNAALEDLEHGDARAVAHARRRVEQLEALLPAIEAATSVAERLIDNAPLEETWSALQAFLEQRVVLPVDPPVLPMLSARLATVVKDSTADEHRGQDALLVVADALHALRIPTCRFGEPAVFVGSLGDALALPFDAVRIVGLSEGTVPPHPRPDAVLPDRLRSDLAPGVLPTADDRALAQLHHFDSVVRHTRQHLALSTPRFTMERSYREPASIVVEVAAAISPSRTLNMSDVRRRFLRPAREQRRRAHLERPLGRAGWLDQAATTRRIHPSWLEHPSTDLTRVRSLLHDSRAMAGLLTPVNGSRIPGLAPERPISASRLRTLLSCPHQFLFDSVLGWHEPSSPRPTRELDALAFGSLFHEVAEVFYQQHGQAFARRKGLLDTYQAHAETIARECFDKLLEAYPLAGPAARDHEYQRLAGQVADFLYFEWHERGKRRFVATERAFGMDAPLAIHVDDGSLWGRGYIDLIEVENGVVLVRDLKTGQCKPRRGKDAAPNPSIDLQLGFYARVVQQLAGELGVPERVGVAYVHTNDRKGRERAFVEDYDQLEEATSEWLRVAKGLLESHAFVRTPHADDCAFCPFRPVCGPDAHAEAAAIIADEDSLVDFAELKS